ncbi:DUF72 domain-containing protein [Thermofilum pendens]|uniref:DUF72 domain-containing protein n=1 Tax=Thermofilum pendens (strain DSM 2475 / Hrk 5) TaxID=368408 RepID=A1RZI5_THEPD|nr:DUF72 domain-containing protein [Thermofilum pendens]ABL78615.1 protein of unknown function DUF72 [Thermofilum pendens Hrk 5]
MARLLVGCCGFPVGRSKYYSMFSAVELQETFYNPPDPEKLAKLRREAPEGFVFTMKAWQAVTHPLDSPTWKRARVKPGKELADRYGFLRPTKEVFEAWELTARAAKALGARLVVLQTPPSFDASDENLRNAVEFFSSVETGDFLLGWEPRGDWLRKPERIAEVVGRFSRVVHVVDPFRSKPVVERPTAYFRLHGIGPGEVNYRYRYTDEDLSTLCSIVSGLGAEEVYVMFNNVYMAQDASRFKEKCPASNK